MNSYELALTAPSRPRVYQFHHLGSRQSSRQVLLPFSTPVPPSNGAVHTYYAVLSPTVSNSASVDSMPYRCGESGADTPVENIAASARTAE